MTDYDPPVSDFVVRKPQPGFQTAVLICPVFEILIGGAKGSGKSEVSRLWMLKGNPDQPQIAGTANVSYLMHPRYRGLVLRRNYSDLEDWLARAREMYEHPDLGGRWFRSEQCFKFPNHITGNLQDGARIIAGHLAEEGAYSKYTGREFHRLNIEECTHIPTENNYTATMSCCRSTFKELRPQVLLSCNPDGVGLQWVKKRFFFDPKTKKRVPPNTVITQEFKNPITHVIDTVTRIFMPATVRDNKILLEQDPQYVTRLMSLPEAQRRAYLDGDFDVMAGDTFFPEFREIHAAGEPENAVHCVPSDSVRIEPWAHRFASCDWGFRHKSAFHWAVQHEEDRRVYVYRELITRFMGSYDLGVTFARMTLPDLAAMEPPILTLWMSPDAFANRDASREGDSTSIVSRFSAGVRDVLGPQSVYVPNANELTVEGVAEEDTEDFFYRKALTERANIVIRRAPNQRVAGWSFLRELLCWTDAELGMASFDREYATKLLREPDGLKKYFRYIEAHQKLATRPGLPRLRIFSDRCPELVDGIKRATFADDLTDMRKVDADSQTGEGGDDAVDSCRYLVSGFLRTTMKVPPEVEYRRKVAKLEERYGGTPLMYQALAKLESDKNYSGSSNGVFLYRDATHPSRRMRSREEYEKLSRHQQEAQHSWFRALTDYMGSNVD